MGETPRQSEEKPKKDWSNVNNLFDKFKAKENDKLEKGASVADKVLDGEDVGELNQEQQNKLKEQLEREKRMNEQRQEEEIKKAREDFEKKWGKK